MHHVVATSTAVIGMLVSIFALLGERLKWASFAEFSVATKVPVEVFFVSGPIVMVTLLLYGILAFLLATEQATSTVFYISASWAIIFLDMSLILYKEWKDMFRRNIDICLHSVNIVITAYAFSHMPYTPTAFIIISLGCWGSLVMSRVVKKFFEKHRPRLPSREIERAHLRQQQAEENTDIKAK